MTGFFTRGNSRITGRSNGGSGGFHQQQQGGGGYSTGNNTTASNTFGDMNSSAGCNSHMNAPPAHQTLARGNTGTVHSDSSGWSVGTGSRFGSVNNEDMESASISTFGNATSVASSNFEPSGNAKQAPGESFGQSTRQQAGPYQVGKSQSAGFGQPNQVAESQPRGGNSGRGVTSTAPTSSQGNDQSGLAERQSRGGNSGRGVTSTAPTSSQGNDQSGLAESQPRGGNSGRGVTSNTFTSSQGIDQSGLAEEPSIAIAADFNSETANIIFLSSESGQGPNRQPITKFRIHEVNLNVHSAVLSEMVDDEDNGEEEVYDDQSERPSIVLEEDAATLKLLFGLMYNRPSPALSMSDWQVVLRMARAAQKYNCARAKEIAAAYFTEQEQLGTLSPFMTYAFATQYKLDALEEAAAERSVRYDLHRLPELVFSMMGFAAYQKLSAFHSRRQSFYSDVLTNICIDPKELADQCYQTGGVCAVGPWNKIKQRLQWPRQAGRDGIKKPPEASAVLRALFMEIGSVDCGSCSRALAEACLTVKTALNSLPRYREDDEASF